TGAFALSTGVHDLTPVVSASTNSVEPAAITSSPAVPKNVAASGGDDDGNGPSATEAAPPTTTAMFPEPIAAPASATGPLGAAAGGTWAMVWVTRIGCSPSDTMKCWPSFCGLGPSAEAPFASYASVEYVGAELPTTASRPPDVPTVAPAIATA